MFHFTSHNQSLTNLNKLILLVSDGQQSGHTGALLKSFKKFDEIIVLYKTAPTGYRKSAVLHPEVENSCILEFGFNNLKNEIVFNDKKYTVSTIGNNGNVYIDKIYGKGEIC